MKYSENEILKYNDEMYYPYVEMGVIITNIHLVLNASDKFETETIKASAKIPYQKLRLLGFDEDCTEFPIEIINAPSVQIHRMTTHHESETGLGYPLMMMQHEEVYGHFSVRLREKIVSNNEHQLSGSGQIVLEDSIYEKLVTLVKKQNIHVIHLDAQFGDLYLCRPGNTDKPLRMMEPEDFPSEEVYIVRRGVWPDAAYGSSSGVITNLRLEVSMNNHD